MVGWVPLAPGQSTSRDTSPVAANVKAQLSGQPLQDYQNVELLGYGAIQLSLGLRAGDEEVVRAFLFSRDDPQRKFVDAEARRIIAACAFADALVAKLGGDHAAYALLERVGIPQLVNDPYALAMMEWEFKGEHASPKDPPTEASGVEFRRVNEIWKRDVTPAQAASNRNEAAARAIREADALTDLTRKLDAGDYKLLADVSAALVQSGLTTPEKPGVAAETGGGERGASAPARTDLASQETNLPQQAMENMIVTGLAEFAIARQTADLNVVRAFLWADHDPDRKIADAEARRMIADYALYRTAAEKFGDGASFKMIERFALSTPDGIALCSTSWKIDGDKATPADDSMGDLHVTLHNVKGIWKIDVSGAAATRSPDAVRKQADTVEKIARDVAAGKYQNTKDVESALAAAGVAPGRS